MATIENIQNMSYTNEHIRRQDRLLEQGQAQSLLQTGEYGILSMHDEDRGAYGIPINFVWNNKTSIYLHCAPQGHKLRCIEKCSDVSFCVVGNTQVVSHQFTTGYESIVLHCKAFTGLAVEERKEALLMLLDKYSPQDKDMGMKYAEKSFHRTEIIRLDILEWSGKCKRVPLSQGIS